MEAKLLLGILEWFLILSVLINFFNAAADGLRGKDLKTKYRKQNVSIWKFTLPLTNGNMYHIFWVLTIFLLLLIPYFGIQVRLIDILAFVLIRFSFFDLVYNYYARDSIFSFGEEGLWDVWFKGSFFDGGFGTGVLLVIRMLMFWLGTMLIQDFFLTNFKCLWF